MHTGNTKIWKHLDFIIMDYVIVEISYLLARWWYAWSNQVMIYRDVLLTRQIAVILAFCVTIEILASNTYNHILNRNRYQEIGAVFSHTLRMAVVEILVLFIIHIAGRSSRLTFAATWIIYFILEMIFRLLWKRFLKHHLLVKNSSKNAMLLVTDHQHADQMVEILKPEQWGDYFLKGLFLTDYHKSDKGTSINGLSVMGSGEDASQYASHNWVDAVMINLPEDYQTSTQIGEHFEKMGITTHYVVMHMPLESSYRGSDAVQKIGDYITVTSTVREVPLIQWIAKRLLDIIGGIVGLVITAIIFLFVAPAIVHADKGPVFYASTRIGKNGRHFKMWKFRSMYQDADARKAELQAENKMNGLMFKVDNDPRILPGVGNFIRKTSLDEFPQFWNVLKGDMSLVGTRPPTLDEWEQYKEQHRIRMVMKPGITGLWQVSGRSEITDFDKVVKLDEEYIETWTVWKDIQILFKTVGKVLKREGAE